ncbi:MAG: D-alanyl-D-alanine carboxypeptidase [Oscillospiraceae bacterium]|nr:D-alanyl-D-alanine carboxypeptidase [Oscillospiraceae bacterium]
MRTFVIIFLILVLFLPAAGAAGPLQTPDLAGSAESAVLMDAATGTVIYQKNARRRAGIASTTKIMTALIVLETVDLDDTFEVPPEAAGIDGSSVYLTPGQKVTVRDLLYGLMLKSGNDAAVALAIRCAGSVDAFAAMMNRKAAQLKLYGTRFRNPHGLSAEGHYSTALDMARLTREAMKNEVFREIVGSKVYAGNGGTMKNHNRMLWFYPGANGVKTGYTTSAGRCLVSSADRDGFLLIAVTLDDHDDWADHTAMLDYGYSNFALEKVCLQGEEVGEVSVFGQGVVPVKAARNVYLLQPKDRAGEKPEAEWFLPRYLYEPVAEGERVGWITVRQGGKIISGCPLVAGGMVAH